MAQCNDNVYIRKGADFSFIDWPEKSQNLILIVFLQSRFFHYQTRASLRLIMLNIYTKFLKNILKDLRVTEQINIYKGA